MRQLLFVPDLWAAWLRQLQVGLRTGGNHVQKLKRRRSAPIDGKGSVSTLYLPESVLKTRLKWAARFFSSVGPPKWWTHAQMPSDPGTKTFWYLRDVVFDSWFDELRVARFLVGRSRVWGGRVCSEWEWVGEGDGLVLRNSLNLFPTASLETALLHSECGQHSSDLRPEVRIHAASLKLGA